MHILYFVCIVARGIKKLFTNTHAREGDRPSRTSCAGQVSFPRPEGAESENEISPIEPHLCFYSNQSIAANRTFMQVVLLPESGANLGLLE